MTEATPSPPLVPLLAHRDAALGDIRLHYVETGPADGPVVLLLHGFPEFWYSWRHQLAALSTAGYRVVAPDLRGYNASERPSGVAQYQIETLVADVVHLIAHLGLERVALVGHDWGGFVAWWVAMLHPDVVTRLAILNCPHPAHGLTMLRDPAQLRRSWYMFFFQLPEIPEATFAADDFRMLRTTFREDPVRRGAFTDDDIDRYVAAFSADRGRGAMNYYRAYLRRDPRALGRKFRAIDLPVLVLWGTQDRYLGIDYARPPERWVPNAEVAFIDDASHWVQVDRPEAVSARLRDFLAPMI